MFLFCLSFILGFFQFNLKFYTFLQSSIILIFLNVPVFVFFDMSVWIPVSSHMKKGGNKQGERLKLIQKLVCK